LMNFLRRNCSVNSRSRVLPSRLSHQRFRDPHADVPRLLSLDSPLVLAFQFEIQPEKPGFRLRLCSKLSGKSHETTNAVPAKMIDNGIRRLAPRNHKLCRQHQCSRLREVSRVYEELTRNMNTQERSLRTELVANTEPPLPLSGTVKWIFVWTGGIVLCALVWASYWPLSAWRLHGRAHRGDCTGGLTQIIATPRRSRLEDAVGFRCCLERRSFVSQIQRHAP
jgi:hypothetical protein